MIGGGDWAKDRIIPDCIRAIEGDGVIKLRSPKAVRPWEHVLEPLSGYLLLAQKMWEEPTKYCEGWNFGPNANSISTVLDVVNELVKHFDTTEILDVSNPDDYHEATLLMLDVTKVSRRLGWEPKLTMSQSIELVADWYRKYNDIDVYELCVDEIKYFLNS